MADQRESLILANWCLLHVYLLTINSRIDSQAFLHTKCCALTPACIDCWTSLQVHWFASSIILIRHSGRVKMRVVVTIEKPILFYKQRFRLLPSYFSPKTTVAPASISQVINCTGFWDVFGDLCHHCNMHGSLMQFPGPYSCHCLFLGYVSICMFLMFP